MSSLRAVVPGASGQIGIFAIPRLLAAGIGVLAVSRTGRPDWYPEFDGVRWLRPDELRSGAAAGADLLLSAGPLRVAGEVARHCPGLRRAVVFSTSSVYSKADSPDREEQRTMRDILAGENRLSAMCEGRGIALCLFRPTLVYGSGMDGNVSWLARWIGKFGFLPVAGRAQGRRQPVHADDLACAAVTALAATPPPMLDTALCGGSTLSFREMVERIFRALGRPVRIVSVPHGLLVALVHAARVLPAFRAVRPEMVRRVAVDLVFDDRPARRVLGFAPRPFEPAAADFHLPDAARLRRLAGL